MKKIKIILIIALAALALLSLVQGCKNAIAYSQDFQYDAAKVLVMGINPYDESINPTGILDSLGFDEYFKQMEANQFPSLLFLLFPYTLFSPLTARYLWLISNLIFTALIIVLLRKTFFKEWNRVDFTIVYLLMIAGTPWRNQIGVGQHTLFSLMFFLLSIYLSENSPFKSKWMNTICSALALSVSYFKYTLTVPLSLYLVYKRKWKELFLSVIPHIILTVFAACYLKDSIINMIIKPLKVASVLTSEGSMDIGSVLGGGYFTMLISLVLCGFLFVLSIIKKPSLESMIISVMTFWSMLVTYHRSYDYFVIIIPFCMFEGIRVCKDKRKAVSFAFYLITVFCVFFVSRILSNTGETPLAVAIIYYSYTLYLTVETLMKKTTSYIYKK